MEGPILFQNLGEEPKKGLRGLTTNQRKNLKLQ